MSLRAVTLDLSNRLATLLPTNPLDPATTYTLTVSAAIRDLQNLALEGPREFLFTTAAPAARGEGAQLTIFEPDAANLPAGLVISRLQAGGKTQPSRRRRQRGHRRPGSPGAFWSTNPPARRPPCSSKPDGSFANFIEAAEEDFISAVFVNANGTRIDGAGDAAEFDDGRIGLFQQGGILEAESDGGPVQVIVEPGAIPERRRLPRLGAGRCDAPGAAQWCRARGQWCRYQRRAP